MTCADNQLAICRVIRGQAYSECHGIPKHIRTQLHIKNWILVAVTHIPRDINGSISSADEATLRSGTFRTDDFVAHFRAPPIRMSDGSIFGV